MVSPNREPQEGGLSPSPIGSGLQGLAPDQNIADWIARIHSIRRR